MGPRCPNSDRPLIQEKFGYIHAVGGGKKAEKIARVLGKGKRYTNRTFKFKKIEPAHEIMALFVLRKLIL